VTRETAQTLDRGVRVLYALADEPDGMSVAEVARHLGVARSIVYRLVTTLEQRAMVRRGADGRYRLGLGVLVLARHVQPLLRSAALPALRKLAGRLGATTFLAVLDGPEALAVVVVEPPGGAAHVACRVGQRWPAPDSPPGVAILRLRTAGHPVLLPPPAVSAPISVGSAVVGIAAPVVGVPGVEASVACLLLGSGSGEESTLVSAAATEVAAGLI